jgi:hypothetical protein
MREYDCNRIDEYNRIYKDYLIDKEGDYKSINMRKHGCLLLMI